MSRCHSLLVFHLEIGSLLNQEKTHVEAICLDCIVDGPLILGVSDVCISSEADELLDSLDVTFTNSIIDRGLTILVLTIYLDSACSAQIRNGISESFPRSVEEGSLLQSILLLGVDT